jgi:hypothetical protein
MSVDQAKEELDFIVEFHGHVKQMIGIVEAWEAKDAMWIANNSTVILNAIPVPDEYKPSYDTVRDTISVNLVRFMELSNRYSVVFSDNLLFGIPTNGRDIQRYRYSFPEVSKGQVIRSILMVKGGAEQHLKDEQRKELEEKNRPLVPQNEPSPFSNVHVILKRFHTVAQQLQHRRQGRPTLIINDEYDVQDLLHGLLTLFFDDIRREEWTPSYAGKSSKVDFLLKAERIVIEVKMTREGLGAKDVGEQLMVDIERYRKMSDCRHLICFVYDPNYRISNPIGFERDLSRTEGDLIVEVLVLPRSF